MSQILYHIQLYGGCSKELLDALQVQQNRAARLVCRRPWRTSTKVLFQEIGWMTVKQLMVHHSILSLYKTRKAGVPKYVHEIISVPFIQQTRLAKTGGIRDIRDFKKGIGQSSYIHRAITYWNAMPSDLRQESNLEAFIPKLKDWVKMNY